MNFNKIHALPCNIDQSTVEQLTMGARNCKISGDGCEVKSVFFACLMQHCQSDCMKEQDEPVKEIDNSKQVSVQPKIVQDCKEPAPEDSNSPKAM
jgi:hypothetical protein